MLIMPKDKDCVYKYLENNCPNHLGGYQNGWLETEDIYFDCHKFIHIYSDNKIIGTVVLWN
jgi:hypothetical protein